MMGGETYGGFHWTTRVRNGDVVGIAGGYMGGVDALTSDDCCCESCGRYEYGGRMLKCGDERRDGKQALPFPNQVTAM
jgi:hypothetical protein